jgi:hypothetical protein
MDLDFEDKFRQCIKKIAEVGELYAEAKGQSWQMQELKGSVLASLISKQGEMPLSKAEIIAKQSEDYKQHILETSLAITKELRLKSEYEKWKSSFEALRSLSSLEKSTRKQLGG